MTATLEEYAQEVQRKLFINNSHLASAELIWKRTRSAVIQGVKDSAGDVDEVSLRDDYLSIRRYCDDARELLTYHNTKIADRNRNAEAVTSRGTALEDILAIDAHLLSAFASRKNDAAEIAHTNRGFCHFPGEAYEDSSPLSDRYRLFTYKSVFKDKWATLLQHSRQEIAGTIAFYSEAVVGQQKLKQQKQEQLLELLDELETASAVAKFTNSPEWLKEAFEKIVMVGGGLLTRQDVELARYLRVLRDGNFQLPETVGASQLGPTSEDSPERVVASRLINYFRKNPAILSDSLKRLLECYDSFKVHTSLSGDLSKVADLHSLRGGELDDIRAIHEVRLVNACYEAAGLPLNIRYVTLSNRIYNFVRAFDRGAIRVPLVHPRNAFLFREEEALRSHLPHITDVCASPASSAHWLTEDGKITPDEIAQFERDFSGSQVAIQQTFLHTFYDEDDEVQELKRDVESLFHDVSTENAPRVTALANQLQTTFIQQKDNAYHFFENRADDLAEKGWQAYRLLQNNNVPLLAHFILPSQEDNATPTRMVCLPIEQRYRNLFVVHSGRLCLALKGKVESQGDQNLFNINFEEILTVWDQEKNKNGKDELENRQNAAIGHYLRALLAISNGDGPMCFSQTRQAREKLGVKKDDSTEDIAFADDYFGFPLSGLLDSSNGSAIEQSRAVLLDQEILYLSHMGMRTLSESTGSIARRMTWLDNSARDLRKSAKLTLCVPKEVANFTTSLNPMSVRQALAASSLIVAWLVQQKDARNSAAFRNKNRRLEAILPPLDDTPEHLSIAWRGLSPLSDGIDEKYSVSAFVRAVATLAKRVEETYDALEKDKTDLQHSREFWRYLTVRAHSYHLTVLACVDADLIDLGNEGATGLPAEDEYLMRIEQMYKNHEKVVSSILGESPDSNAVIQGTYNHFTRAMINAAKMRSIVNNQAGEQLLAKPDEAMVLYGLLWKDCGSLNQFGFPRRIVRALKERYGKIVVNHIQSCIGKEQIN